MLYLCQSFPCMATAVIKTKVVAIWTVILLMFHLGLECCMTTTHSERVPNKWPISIILLIPARLLSISHSYWWSLSVVILDLSTEGTWAHSAIVKIEELSFQYTSYYGPQNWVRNSCIGANKHTRSEMTSKISIAGHADPWPLSPCP